MADRPILFSAPMVRALLDGRKTQTRRIFNDIEQLPSGLFHIFGGMVGVSEEGVPKFAPDYCRIQPADRLYVREHWCSNKAYDDLRPSEMGGEEPIHYKADNALQTWGFPTAHFDQGRHRQGMHMPRWASRLTLIVTDVRVQRLQDISPYDALAEGVCAIEQDGGAPDAREVQAFAELWDSINAKRGYGWDVNPWVAAYTFRVIKQNIDDISAHGAA